LKRRNVKRAVAHLCTLAMALCIALAGEGCNGKSRSNMSGFDTALWKAQHGRDEALENPRTSMVGPLIEDRLKAGMSRAEVLELLGPPEFQRNDSDYYTLGRSPYGVDYEYLVVHYVQDKMTLARLERG
jgi:hypothetical protein